MKNDPRPRSTKTFKDGKEGLGQNGLYWKLVRSMAEFGVANGSEKSVDELIKETHKAFRTLYAAGKSTSKMSVSEMHIYYSECQQHSVEMLGGVSGMDEDSLPFDHGFKSE